MRKYFLYVVVYSLVCPKMRNGRKLVGKTSIIKWWSQYNTSFNPEIRSVNHTLPQWEFFARWIHPIDTFAVVLACKWEVKNNAVWIDFFGRIWNQQTHQCRGRTERHPRIHCSPIGHDPISSTPTLVLTIRSKIRHRRRMCNSTPDWPYALPPMFSALNYDFCPAASNWNNTQK